MSERQFGLDKQTFEIRGPGGRRRFPKKASTLIRWAWIYFRQRKPFQIWAYSPKGKRVAGYNLPIGFMGQSIDDGYRQLVGFIDWLCFDICEIAKENADRIEYEVMRND